MQLQVKLVLIKFLEIAGNNLADGMNPEKIPAKELIFSKISVCSPPLQILFFKNVVFIEEHL